MGRTITRRRTGRKVHGTALGATNRGLTNAVDRGQRERTKALRNKTANAGGTFAPSGLERATGWAGGGAAPTLTMTSGSAQSIEIDAFPDDFAGPCMTLLGVSGTIPVPAEPAGDRYTLNVNVFTTGTSDGDHQFQISASANGPGGEAPFAQMLPIIRFGGDPITVSVSVSFGMFNVDYPFDVVFRQITVHGWGQPTTYPYPGAP